MRPGLALLPCRVGDGVDPVSQVRHFALGGAHLLVAWRESTVHVVEAPGPELRHLESSRTHDPMMLDAPVEDFLSICDSIRCLDKAGGFYELKQSIQQLPSDSMFEEDLFSDGEATMVKQFRFVKNLKLNKVVKLAALSRGLVLIKKHDKGNVFLMNFYTNELARRFSITLPGFSPQDEADCFLAPCTAGLDPGLRRLLLRDPPEGDADVLFAGWGGHVYAIAVDLRSPSVPVLRQVYHSDHPVTAVLVLEGAVLGIVLSVGCVVCVAPAAGESLCYTTVYLPTAACPVLCAAAGRVVCGDGRRLWLCRLLHGPSLELRCAALPVRSVTAAAPRRRHRRSAGRQREGAGDGEAVLARSEGTDPVTDVLQAIHEGSGRVQQLGQQVAAEDELIAGLNVATRVDTLRDHFEVKVTVDCAEAVLAQGSSMFSNVWCANTKDFYQVNVVVRNLTRQQFQAPAWSLAVRARAGGETCTRLVSLEDGLGEHRPVALRFPLAVPGAGVASVEVRCGLVSRLLRPGRPWVLVDAGAASLDVSHFLEPSTGPFSRLLPRRREAASVREDLARMAHANSLGPPAEPDCTGPLRSDELKCVLRLQRPVEARSLWRALLGQCLHRLPPDLRAQSLAATPTRPRPPGSWLCAPAAGR
ncbi:uncharacterized protein LOC134528496 isoform X2 [Bacillus rossius redtenbacheri]|uniref:uncharacterized protein LOC134528496 isoform X2 n=1 Tax=Bacillus rossius redtenbacheri TaxID=93214 RepID=UPI002FDCD10E